MSWIYTILVSSLLATQGAELPFTHGKSERSKNTSPAVRVKDETEKFEQTYPITPNGTVKISNINGSIVLEAWDRNEVKLEAVKTAHTKDDLASVEIKVDSRPDSLSVEADYGQWKWGQNKKDQTTSVSIEFKLSVPRNANLSEIETVNGSVTVSNFANSTKISAVNGNVIATNLRGSAVLSTVNGEVNADFDLIELASRVNLSTVNGKVNLSLPSDCNATVKADSLNGNITNGFGLPVRKGEYIGRDLFGKIGTGEAQVRLNTVNGELNITRKNDGRTQSPATNLLQTKRGNDRGGLDMNMSMDINSDQMNRDVKDAMKQAQRATADASREVAKALESVRMKDLVNMENLKIDIDENAIKRTVEQGLKARQDSLIRLRDVAWLGNMPMVTRKTNVFNVKGTPTVAINADSCSVKVRGWDRSEVKYAFTEMPSIRENSAKVTELQNGNELELTIINDDGEPAFLGDILCRIEVFVPRKANLKIVSEGEIRLEGVSGELEIDGQDESIDVRGSDGKLQIKNVDGNVRVVGFIGELIARTDDGEMLLDGDFSKIEAHALDGKYILTVPPVIDADVISSSEQTAFDDLDVRKIEGNRWRLGSGSRKYSFTSTDGAVEVRSRDIVSVR